MAFSEILARFEWPDGEATETLAVRPLLNVTPSTRRPSWSLEVLSGQVHTEKLAISTSEISGTLRFITDPTAAMAMFRDRVGLPVVYREERPGRPEWVFPCILLGVDPGDGWATGLNEDPQRAAHGEYAARVRLRRVDGGDFAEILRPADFMAAPEP